MMNSVISGLGPLLEPNRSFRTSCMSKVSPSPLDCSYRAFSAIRQHQAPHPTPPHPCCGPPWLSGSCQDYPEPPMSSGPRTTSAASRGRAREPHKDPGALCLDMPPDCFLQKTVAAVALCSLLAEGQKCWPCMTDGGYRLAEFTTLFY